jgi:rSAM/selenodomain-associated transferase 2
LNHYKICQPNLGIHNLLPVTRHTSSHPPMKISVVIPTYNEAVHIEQLVRSIVHYGGTVLQEVIVTDGGSTDGTRQKAAAAGAKAVLSPQKGRAAQMNYAASIATGDILYFVHADVKLHPPFAQQIIDAVAAGCELGCYRFRFQSHKRILRFNSYMTRFHTIWTGGGDQTLFIQKNVFEQLQGFRNDYRIMEDFDLLKRAKKKFRFKILPYDVLVSARKYDKNSWLRVQFANAVILLGWKMGASQEWMVRTYKKLLYW